jgi:hypothetical protein
MRRRIFTSRWWRTAGLTFGLVSCCGVILSLIFSLIAAWSYSLDRWTTAVTVSLSIVIPLTLAFIAATLSEGALPAEEPRPASRRRRILLTIGAFAFPFVAGPAGLMLWFWSMNKSEERELAKMQAFDNRPITTSSGDFLCAPPRYFMRDGLLAAELTARLPTAGRYGWYVLGSDPTQSMMGRVDTLLSAGLHVVAVKLEHGNGKPVRPETVRWPIVIRHIALDRLTEGGEPVWLDGRGTGGWEDSLTIVEKP